MYVQNGITGVHLQFIHLLSCIFLVKIVWCVTFFINQYGGYKPYQFLLFYQRDFLETLHRCYCHMQVFAQYFIFITDLFINYISTWCICHMFSYLLSSFLRAMRKYRAEGRKIYYLDESYINAGHTVRKNWFDTKLISARQSWLQRKSNGNPRTIGKGKRVIIAAVMNEAGIVPGTELLWQSGLRDPLLDYHKEMNHQVFEMYLEKTVLPRLETGSVLVIGKRVEGFKLLWCFSTCFVIDLQTMQHIIPGNKMALQTQRRELLIWEPGCKMKPRSIFHQNFDGLNSGLSWKKLSAQTPTWTSLWWTKWQRMLALC